MNTTWQQAPRQPARKPVTGVLLTLAAVLALAWALAPRIPLTVNGSRVTLGQAHALCVSWIGTIAQALSQRAADDCGTIATVYDLRNIAGIGAVACGIAAAVMAWRAGPKTFSGTAGALAVLAAVVLLIPAPALTAASTGQGSSVNSTPAAASSPVPATTAPTVAASSPQPSPSPVFPDRAGCVADGGQPVWDYSMPGEPLSDPVCRNVPYLGTDGMTYYLLNVAWPAAGPLDTSGAYAATAAECASGNYPDANPGVSTPGQWNTTLGLCQPRR